MTATPPTSSPVPDGDQDADFDDLASKFVRVARLRHPRAHLVLRVLLGVLAAVCLLATITRASLVPLIPLAGLAVAGYAAWRFRAATTDRQLVGRVTVFAVAVAVSLWSMSYLARTLL